jgi:hypothetical protein
MKELISEIEVYTQDAEFELDELSWYGNSFIFCTFNF